MAHVCETSAQPSDAWLAGVCMDDQPVHWLQNTRVALAAPTPHARRVDADYERAGTARVGIVAEPWQGWRPVRVRPQRTQVDWA